MSGIIFGPSSSVLDSFAPNGAAAMGGQAAVQLVKDKPSAVGYTVFARLSWSGHSIKQGKAQCLPLFLLLLSGMKSVIIFSSFSF